MKRTGFSIIEIVMAMGILAILTTVTLLTYQDERVRAEDVVTQMNFKKFRDVIIRWQLENKRPWFLPGPPNSRYHDTWGQPLKVDPRKGVIWSMGPDGDFKSAAEAGELSLAYDPYPAKSAGSPQRVQGRPSGGGGITLTWTWPASQGTAIGYRIQKSDSPATPFEDIGDVLPTAKPSFTDPSVQAGKTYYYRVAALLGPGSKEPVSPPSRPYAVASPVTTNPVLKVSTSAGSAPAGSTILFRVEGSPSGAPLQRLVFQGTPHQVGPGSFSLELPLACPAAGPFNVEVALFDSSGNSATEVLPIVGY